MLPNAIAQISLIAMLFSNSLVSTTMPNHVLAPQRPIASREFSLEKRYYPVQKENILLNLAYMNGNIDSAEDINWDEIQKPQTYSFRLNPGESFAFHDSTLPEYKNVVKTTNAHFNSMEGFRSYGYLIGDGVCHLASLMYWTALDAGLKTEAPASHNFMLIPGIDRKYGVSIFSNPRGFGDAKQNLYITNNKQNPVEFDFDYNGKDLKVSVSEIN